MNGNEVRVWVDRWLPSIPLGRPFPLGTVPISLNLRVNSLLCNENGGWDIDFLKPFVVEEELNAISETHTGDSMLKDRLVWPFEKKGIYLVKFGYHWAMARTRLVLGATCFRMLLSIVGTYGRQDATSSAINNPFFQGRLLQLSPIRWLPSRKLIRPWSLACRSLSQVPYLRSIGLHLDEVGRFMIAGIYKVTASIVAVVEALTMLHRSNTNNIAQTVLLPITTEVVDPEFQNLRGASELRQMTVIGSNGGVVEETETASSHIEGEAKEESVAEGGSANVFSVDKSPVQYFMEEMLIGNSLRGTTTLGNEKERDQQIYLF
ncbi:ribonuclease H protein [Pyrus ussuriensis x Pyrus communis]|uniref:Ribonuclease H protein n=1 Tax=Pyrus ussuriensis x Pyrus communis TaxID=2448454 RepID=A0A5N5H6M5_9ROSA|nr:ribonuclease H protein [Pyrus ussuriensis x Pyrus communis]